MRAIAVVDSLRRTRRTASLGSEQERADSSGREATASVPVACPMARSEAVCSGYSRTRRIGSELQIVSSAKHDKPVPKLIVRLWRTCSPDVDQSAIRTAIQAGSEAVGQPPPEP
jgi:hypothetical protein